MRNLSSKFKALGDETRLKIMGLIIRHGELCVCDFIKVLGLPRSKISRHLRYLLNAGLLEDRRDAVWIYYSIAHDLTEGNKALIKAIEKLLDPGYFKELDAKLDSWLEKKKNGASAEC